MFLNTGNPSYVQIRLKINFDIYIIMKNIQHKGNFRIIVEEFRTNGNCTQPKKKFGFLQTILSNIICPSNIALHIALYSAHSPI